MRATLIIAMCLLYGLSLTLVLNAAGPSAEEMALYKARKYGALAKECLKVIDQDGMTVVGAKVWGGIQYGDGYNDFTPISGMTDTNGEYVIQGKCTNRIRCDITKVGYYRTEFLLENYGYGHTLKDGKWQPYGTVQIVPLREIKNLGKLCVFPDSKRMCRWKIPAHDRWIGFDLEVFDWVEPVGKGKHDDVLIRFRSEMKNQYFDFHFDMDISFTNNPYAGVYERKKDKFSTFEWDYNADTNCVFKDSLSFWCEHRPGKRGVNQCLAEDSYLVFRTRTKVDEEGNLKEAHYGVISGEWISGSETMRISDGCFNPVANDTNIEDGYYLRKKVQWAKESK